MHYQVWPQVKKKGKPINNLLWRIFAHLNINIVCSEGKPPDHPTARQTDHAVSTSSVDAAACRGLTGDRTGAGFRGADGGTTWKPCIQREQRAERGWGQPTAHRWKR